MIKLDIFYRLHLCQQKLREQQQRWILWLPVLMGIGIVSYFQLNFEPWIGTGFMSLSMGAALLYFIKNKNCFWFILFIKLVLLIALGFSSAQFKTWRMATFMVCDALPPMAVEGTLIKIEKMTGRVRLTLSQVKLEDKVLSNSINLVRISCRGAAAKVADSWVPGQRISLRAKLLPPNEPIAPGSYDFRRRAYFEGISAVGYGVTTPKIISKASSQSKNYIDIEEVYKLAQVRHHITEQLSQKIAGPEGAIAASLVTGDRSGIPEHIRQAFADSGLAHILAISGLHLSIAAGLAFFFVRKTLSLVPSIALYYPIKKWAAGAAIVFTLGYLFISGLTIPAQRAFVMTCMVLMGIIVDRTVLTLRNVTLTATLILLISPDSLMSPSFQMSFAAVTALVSGYEILHQPLMRWRCESHSRLKKILFYLLGISLSTILATIATTPYIIYTFNRLTLHAIPANLVAIPLLSFVVMPLLVLFIFTISVGSTQFIGYLLKLSIGVMVKIATWISMWPGSVILIPTMPPEALAFFTLGAVWIIIWKDRWRWQGLWGVGIGLILMIFHQPPDIYINADKSLVIFRNSQEHLEHNLIVNSMRAGRFARESWMKRTASLDCLKLKDCIKQKKQGLDQDFITANSDHVILHFKKSDVLFQEQEKCFHSDWECQLIHQKTGQTLKFLSTNGNDQGGCLLWITPSGFYEKTVAQEIGTRPWSSRASNSKT
ncbi:MAG: ComEC/Rec2 family competence protein [Janthinobacterium lividum]